MQLPISVIILTQNEEENIEFCLSSLNNRFSQVIVVDSFSEDNTVPIVSSYNNVELFQNKFISWADQRNWILDNATIINEYVFFLDADEVLTNDFINELSFKTIDNMFDQIYINIEYVFMNKVLKYSYGHPPIRRIFRKNLAKFIPDGAREYAIDSHNKGSIKSPVIHNDRKSLMKYFHKQLNNAVREAANIQKSQNFENIPENLKKKLFVRYKIWNMLPNIIKLPLYFLYRYIFKLSFLDGFPGFVYVFMFTIWYQLMITVFKYDIETK